MFTGIIEEVGELANMRKGANSAVLTIKASKVLEDAQVGDSIAVNGVCLTVTSCTADHFTADVMHETLNRSSLGSLRAGGKVNLERAMPANGRFGGHFVSGHIDGTGVIRAISHDDNATWYRIRTAREILHYIVEKGSIAIDGISLTVAAMASDDFSVSIIPHTLDQTTLAQRRVGDTVNLECDIIGKYVERFVTEGAPSIYSAEINQPGKAG